MSGSKFTIPCAILLAIVLVVSFLGTAAASTPEAKKETDKSLSPYFFVQADGEDNTDYFPLLETRADVEISGVIARVKVTQRYANRGGAPINARYIFPGSTKAAVHGLAMTIGDRTVRAQIKEKEQARQIYETARKEGKSASLLEQQRPNVFSMDVANIMPGDNIDVVLEYSELVTPTDGIYEFIYPAVVGPRYSGRDEGPDKAAWVGNPYLKAKDETQTMFGIDVRVAAGLPVSEVACSTHPVTISYESADVAKIALNTSEFTGNRDYILRYRLDGDKIVSGLLLFEGQDENFFLLMAQPPKRPADDQIPGREYIFVVDVSGSMNGFPLDTAKKLFLDLSTILRPEDRFNMLFFSGSDETLAPTSLPATPENIQLALDFFGKFSGAGGTELLPALRRAFCLPAEEGYSRNMLVITDGYISAEKEAFDIIRGNLDNTNVFAFGIGSSVNRHLIEGLAKVGRGEPFVVTNPAESAQVAKRFFEYISTPVLTDIKLSFSGFGAYDLEPAKAPDLFAKRPLLVFGKWKGEKQGSVTISGISGKETWRQSFDLDKIKADKANEGLRYLWARERLAQISDYAGDSDREAIVSLGLKYNLLTAHTSFVAVDDIIRNTSGDAKNIKQPLPLPQGVSELAVASPESAATSSGGSYISFFGASSTPEPEFWLMLAFAALGLATGFFSKTKRARRG